MVREDYVNRVVSGLLSSLQDRLRDSIQPPVDVDATLSSLTNKLQTLFTETMTKSLDDLEHRFGVYAERCIPMVHANQFQKMKRSISKSEKHVRTNFALGEQEIFERKLARSHRHRNALKACFQKLIRDLNLPGSSLLDVLHEKHVMSTSDLESVRHGGNPKRVNEEFVLFVCGKLTLEDFNNVFLPTLDKDHPHLCRLIVDEMDKLLEEEDSLCIACRVRSDVQVKRLAAPLYSRKAITLALYSDLTGAGLSNSAKWAELEKQNTSHQEIIESLSRKYPDFHRDFKERQRNTLDCFCQSEAATDNVADSNVSEDVVDGQLGQVLGSESALEDDHLTTRSLIDTKEDFDELLMSFQIQNTETDYKMKPTDRGSCLIINNITFERTGRRQLRQRDGSEKDGDRLEQTFRRLGFSVVSVVNQTAEQIVSIVTKYSRKIDHSNSDAFVCCLLSHGTKDLIYGVDGVPVPVPEITLQFTAFKCPSLVGKPKLFFVQADRGKNKMKGYTMPPHKSDDAPGPTPHHKPEQEVIAEEADFLIGYCTPPGYASYRSRSKGSWYIKTLCDVLDEQAEHNDLLSCLVMVNDQIARANACMEGGEQRMEKQIPAPVFTLRKKVYLTADPSSSQPTRD